jgi:hypothetical protein
MLGFFKNTHRYRIDELLQYPFADQILGYRAADKEKRFGVGVVRLPGVAYV